MSKILARVTRGRIRKGTVKKVLVFAVAGQMYFAKVVVKKPIVGGSSNYREEVLEELEVINEFYDLEIIEIVKITLTNFII